MSLDELDAARLQEIVNVYVVIYEISEDEAWQLLREQLANPEPVRRSE